jgi:hypothetical protein
MTTINYTSPTIFNNTNVKKRGGRNVFISKWYKTYRMNKVTPEQNPTSNNNSNIYASKRPYKYWFCYGNKNNKITDDNETATSKILCCGRQYFYGNCKCKQ